MSLSRTLVAGISGALAVGLFAATPLAADNIADVNKAAAPPALGTARGYDRAGDHRASVSRHHEAGLQCTSELRREGAQHDPLARSGAREEHARVVQPRRLEREGDARRYHGPQTETA